MTAWLNVIGVGADGLDGLSARAKECLIAAEIVVGGRRHHAMTDSLSKRRIYWPSPFSALIDTVRGLKPQRVVVLVSGDPLWYSAGEIFAKEFSYSEVCFHPHVSAFQLACSRMGWSLAEVETLSIHGRPVEQIAACLHPGAKFVALTSDRTAPDLVARLLVANCYGPSKMTVLGKMGTSRESRHDGVANSWQVEHPSDNIANLHTLCIHCAPEEGASLMPTGSGLPDHAFETDGVMTKREIRALTISALSPYRGALLWDIGSASGSVAIEWMRSARNARAIGIEPNENRRRMATVNARKLGVPNLSLVAGRAPEALASLPVPDAVFVGGGLSSGAAETAIDCVMPYGRVVANAVSLESESRLERLHAKFGGNLVRVNISRAEPIGRLRGWKSLMPVTQWTFVK